MVTTDIIKELRDSTGVSVMQCKKALEKAGGNKEKALVILKNAGAEAALKVGARNLKAGIIASYIHSTGVVGVMIELACETDFVARNSEFKQLAYDIAMHITASKPEFLKKEDITEKTKTVAVSVFEKELELVLLDQAFIKNPEITVGELINSAVQKFGEKIEVVRFIRYAVAEK